MQAESNPVLARVTDTHTPGASFRRELFQGHTRIATVSCSTAIQAAHAIRQAYAADAIEIRLDALWPQIPDAEKAGDDLAAIVEAASTADAAHAAHAAPATDATAAGHLGRKVLVAALRPRRYGGQFVGPEDVRVNLLAAALKSGFAAVDIESDIAQVPGIATALRGDHGLIVSHHELAQVPCREDGMRALLGMQDLKAGLDKLVFEAGAFPDLLRAFELARGHALRGGRPSIATTSHGGAQTRALLALVGNRATYGYAQGSPAAVPGQPALAEVEAMWTHWGLGQADLDSCAERPAPWLAVIGMPVAHSLSPRIHNAALRAAGRPERYGALDVPASAAALRLACIVAPRIGLAGASVTAPHKVDALRMGEPDAIASAVGAANCLRWDGDVCKATNTDASALQRILTTATTPGQTVLVLGAGGAARASLWAARELGLHARVAGRDAPRGQAVAAAFGATWLPWDAATSTPADVVVQTTPLGVAPPLAANVLAQKPHVVEFAYGAEPSAFLLAAAAAKCEITKPTDVLLEQAVASFRFWFNAEPDRRAMQGALAG